MKPGEGIRPAFSRREVHEARETPQTNTINDVLGVFKGQLHSHVRDLSPDFEEDARAMAEGFCQEFLCLLNPAAERVHLNGSQSVFVREALFESWAFKGYPSDSPAVDQNKVLGVATYLNSLVPPERR
jgi:hypothetical protein